MAHRQRQLIGLLAAGSLAAAGLAAPATAMAAGSIITVTIEYDGSAAGDGLCSLREAIVAANANAGNTNDDCADGQSGEADQIQMPFPAGGRINLTSNLPSITDPSGLSIEGFGNVVIDGQDSYTPFTIVGGSLTLSELVVQNGFGTLGGAVTNDGSVTIIRSTIRSSSAFNGGGIYNSGSMTIIASTIEGNRAQEAGGGIFNEGSIMLKNVTLAGNHAVDGGALNQSAGESTLRHVTVSLNTGDVAAVRNAGGTLDIFSSIVANNVDGQTSGATNHDSVILEEFAGILDPGGLKDNGGPTKTIRLVGGSNPALGLGAHATCSDVGFVDQRGFARPSGATATCDAGAVQRDRHAPAKVRNPSMGLRHDVLLAKIRARVLDWAFDDGTGLGIQRFSLQRQLDGGSWKALSTNIPPEPDIATAATAHYNVNLVNWHTYRFRVRAVDFDGNVSVWAYSPTVTARLVQQTSSAVTFSRTGWSTVSSTSYSGGSVRTSTTPGSSVRITFTGRAMSLVTTYRGGPPITVDAYVDGVYRGQFQHSSFVTQYLRQVWPFRFSGSSEHTIRFVNVGPGRLDIDAFASLK